MLIGDRPHERGILNIRGQIMIRTFRKLGPLFCVTGAELHKVPCLKPRGGTVGGWGLGQGWGARGQLVVCMIRSCMSIAGTPTCAYLWSGSKYPVAMDGVKDDIHVINSRRDPQMHTMCQFLTWLC